MTNTPKLPEEPKHYTEEDFDEKGCWCNPKAEYVKETDSWVVIHNTLLPDDSHKIN